MNVKMLIQNIRQRPEMFIGTLEMDALHHFISGFLFSNIMNNQADYVDIAFKNRFHEWTRQQLEKGKDINDSEHRNYVYYLNYSCKKRKRIDAFFELCDAFFAMIEQEKTVEHDKENI